MLKRAVLFTLLVGIFLAPLNSMKPPKASAWLGNLPACGSVGLQYWDWPKAVRDITGGGYAGFHPENSKYVLGRTEHNPAGGSPPKIYLWEASGTGNLTFNKVGLSYELKSSTTMKLASINDGPKELYPDNNYTLSSTDSSPGNNPTTVVQCIYAAKNVVYSSAWDQAQFNSSIQYKDSANSCKATDFGCWIGKAFNGIGDGINAVGQAIIKSIAWLWAPDGAKTKADFDDLSAFLTTKLGFLTYPFTFLSNIFGAFGSTTNNWCTSGSCTKNFGNLFGKPFILNFNQGAITYPTLWAWFLSLTRGLVVFGLIMAVRKKYLGVVHK